MTSPNDTEKDKARNISAQPPSESGASSTARHGNVPKGTDVREEDPKEEKPQANKPAKKHLIKPRWLRITLKTLMWILIAVLLLPVLLYIPPVQTFVKNIACNVVYKSTGMKIGIDKFRLKFPVNVSLNGVYVLDEHADTMVRAREVVADVKLLPLLGLDVKINRLQLEDGYYRMVSPDSSMIMTISAGLLNVDDRSSANIGKSEINLNKAYLRDGDVRLYMNVWKQKPSPSDSTSTPFLINANELKLENFSFAMSMLPTIDTLRLVSQNVELRKGVIDLRKNLVTWQRAAVSDGRAVYLTPTPEYIKTHPAPVSEPSDAPPMTIKGDSLSLDRMSALYATKGAEPLPGFDAAYIEVSDVALGMRNFYNQSSTVRLPITRLQARERSGLQIVSGSGTVGVDSVGLNLRDLNVKTAFSALQASADIPFALMELKPDAPMAVTAKARLGLPDIDSFMPSLKEYTRLLPARNPINLDLRADGSLGRLSVEKLDAALAGVLSLEASGYAANPLDMKRLEAKVDFNGKLSDPTLIDKFTGDAGIKVPAFTLDGTATARHETYAADFDLRSTAGNLAGRGRVALNPETYNVDMTIHDIDVAQFMPDLGIGKVNGSIRAEGSGFNPLSGRATTDAEIDIHSIEYNKRQLSDLRANVVLARDGAFDLYAVSTNPGMDFDIEGKGVIKPDDYTYDLEARLRDIDLQRLGLSETMNNGKGTIKLTGTASPEKWLYDARLDVTDFDWNLPDQYIHLPSGLTANVKTTNVSTFLSIDSYLTRVEFTGGSGLKTLMDSFTAVGTLVTDQIKQRNIDINEIGNKLPPFKLAMTASGRGLLNQFLTPSGLALDTIYANLYNDSIIYGDAGVRELTSGTLKIDTINLAIKERNSLLDYKIHIGNRPGTLDEFAQVQLQGYLGHNRVGAFLTQHNIKGEMGYKLGMTAALADSTVTIHFTPQNSTIAYMPWKLNKDNFIDYCFPTMKVQADLQASSAESSILLRTEPHKDGGDELHLKLDNIKIQDFLSMSVTAPPVTGSVNSDLRIYYNGRALTGGGTLDVSKLTYDKTTIGDFDLNVKAGMEKTGRSGVLAAMKINGEPALAAYAVMRTDTTGIVPDSLGLKLTRFPLAIANPFLDNMVALGGHLNGNMRMDGSFLKPVLNGSISFDTVTARIPMAGATLRFDQDPVKVTNSVINFDNFEIFGANKNPLTINGSVDAQSLGNILLDLTMKGDNCQLIGNDKRAKSDLYGKLFVNLDGSVKGSLSLMDIRANLNILGTTDLTYALNMAPSEFTGTTDSENIVKFVNFNDTTQVAAADSVAKPSTMRIRAGLTISPGTQLKVLLSSNGTDRVELQPTANLNFSQSFMGDMRLNGTLTLGNGFARYAIPVIGEKMFTFAPNSSVTWGGDLMNPTLNITATDDMKANVTQDGNSRLVNFLVTLRATNNLDNPKVSFDLSTNDDMSIQNELQSMSADQRQTQAMNLLLYGQYQGQNMKANANLGGNMLYGFLESQLNSWAAKTIRGVDLSFGIDQYDKMQNGVGSTETSYSYQVSKSLFNNRFKINVGGNYSTDASADENLSQNLVSDVSLEYILKQTETMNMSVRIFRHTGFESILEGEITEMGAGFVLKRKLQNLLHLFRFRKRKRRDVDEPTVSVKHEVDSMLVQHGDSLMRKEIETTMKKEETDESK